MVDLSKQPAKAPNSQAPPEEEEVATGGPFDTKANPDPRPEEAVSEENRLKMEAAEKLKADEEAQKQDEESK